MVHIPELGGRTQAFYPREVEPMARECIAMTTGTPIDPGGYQLASPHAASWFVLTVISVVGVVIGLLLHRRRC
jgi:hypothetical protein